MGEFKREIRKVGLWLIVGVALLILVNIYMVSMGNKQDLKMVFWDKTKWDTLWVLYPLGFKYGWHNI